MTRLPSLSIRAAAAPEAPAAGGAQTRDAPRQRPTAPATALAALLFGLVVPGAHAAYIGNAHSAAVGTPPPLAFADPGTTPGLANHAATAAARATATHPAAATTAGRTGQPDELAFNSTLTLAGIGLLCLVVHRRRASARRA